MTATKGKRRRRQRGTGSLRQVAEGKFQARFGAHSEVVFARTRSEANAKL